MARFLYFLPIDPPANWSGLPEGHVKDVLRGDPNCIIRGCLSGPTGEAGCVALASGDDETAPGFYPDKQTWRDGYPWGSLGWENDKLPGPEDLLRKDAVGGEPMALGDGREWLLPLLGPAWQELPGDLVDTPEGGCEVVMRESFKPLCKESEWWWDTLRQLGGYQFQRLANFVSDALATNYRVGWPEVGTLKLLSASPQEHTAILSALVGFKRLAEESKKKLQAGGPSAAA